MRIDIHYFFFLFQYDNDWICLVPPQHPPTDSRQPSLPLPAVPPGHEHQMPHLLCNADIHNNTDGQGK